MSARMSEADLMRAVTDLATILGWEWVHFRPAQTQRGWRTPVQGPLGKGWPDLVLIRSRDRRLVFAELKSDKGKTSAEQERVFDVLYWLTTDGCHEPSGRKVGGTAVESHRWWPADLDRGSIEAVLR